MKSQNNSAAHCVPVRLFYVPPTLPQKNKSYYRYVITSKILNEIHALEKKTRISCFEKLIYFFSYQGLIINSTWKFTLLSMFVSDHLSWTNALYHWRWLLTYSFITSQRSRSAIVCHRTFWTANTHLKYFYKKNLAFSSSVRWKGEENLFPARV